MRGFFVFYSPTAESIVGNSTHLNTRQVFTGQYWDEFGITPHLVPNQARVLMLGLAMGGGIRPILSSTKEIDLHAVDSDQRSLEDCQAFYRRHFPALPFQCTKGDAELFLYANHERFDAIWLDLYLPESYSPLLFRANFLELVRANLTPNGVLLANAYGLPNQFTPLQRDGAQSAFFQRLQTIFPCVRALPYRRNLTFIASAQGPELYEARPHAELSAIDKQSLRAQRFFLQSLGSSSTRDVPIYAEEIQLQHIDQEMRAAWRIVLQGLAENGLALAGPQDLLGLIQDPERAIPILDRSVERYADWLNFFPILAAGEANLRNLAVDWLYDWFFSRTELLRRSAREAWLQIWLKQLWALAINPNSRYRQHSITLLAEFSREVR